MDFTQFDYDKYLRDLEYSPNTRWFVKVFLVSAVVALGTGFWHFCSFAIMRDNSSGIVGIENNVWISLFRSAICALGFIGVAIRWEESFTTLLRLPLLLLLLIFSFLSTFWSNSPSTTLADSIFFLLIAVFSMAIAQNIEQKKIPLLFAYSSLILVISQLLLSMLDKENGFSKSISSSEISLLVVSSLYALVLDRKYLHFWIVVVIFSFFVAIYVKEYSAIFSFVSFIVTYFSKKLAANSNDSSFRLSTNIVLILIISMMYAIFISSPAIDSLMKFLESLGNKTSFGIGFGGPDKSLISNFVFGLGTLGMFLGCLNILSFFGIVILSQNTHYLIMAYCAGLTTIVLVSPNNVNYGGVVMCALLSIIFTIMEDIPRDNDPLFINRF